MKNYVKPEMKITSLNNETSILLSGGINITNGNFSKGSYTRLHF